MWFLSPRAGAKLLAMAFTAVLALGAPALYGHPSHSSYAEIEWSDAGTLDVALRVIPEDLERALGLVIGRRLVLVDSPEIRTALTAYLSEHFALLGDVDDGAPAKLRLVGMELGYKETWVYFSLEGPRERHRTLRNSVLMDVEPTQTNWVRRLWEPDAPAMEFSIKEPERDLVVRQ